MSESFNLQPTLTGELLSVRPLDRGDLESLFKVSSDPLVWEQHPFPKHERVAFAEFFRLAIESKGALAIIDNQTQEIIGTSRYYNLSSNAVFVGYTFLARSIWGGKYNFELKQLMLGYALKFVPEVFFDIGESNLRSRRAIEKVGANFVKLQTIKDKPYTLYVIDRKIFYQVFKI